MVVKPLRVTGTRLDRRLIDRPRPSPRPVGRSTAGPAHDEFGIERDAFPPGSLAADHLEEDPRGLGTLLHDGLGDGRQTDELAEIVPVDTDDREVLGNS